MDRSVTVDRALLAVCAVVWLAVVGVGVAAIVALVALGSGRAGNPGAGSGTPWGLYVVIGVSAAIILGSIPLLLRARRAAQQEPPPRQQPATAGRYSAADEGATEKLRVFGSDAGRRPPVLPYAGGTSPEMVDRMWLRFVASMATAMGAATLAVATATYFMGVRDDGAAWAALTVAGVITALMPIIPWWQLRELRAAA